MDDMEILSLKDMAYKQAKAGDSLSAQAAYALENIKGFPQEIPSEAKTELWEGYRMRYNETHPPMIYAIINGHYTLATEEQSKNKKVEKIEIGVGYAFSFTSQEFGKLAQTNKLLYETVKKWREDTNDYCSNRFGDLKRAANKIINKGQDRSRKTLDFVQSLNKIFGDMEKSVKVKCDRGDTTANPAKYKLAVVEFWKTYKV